MTLPGTRRKLAVLSLLSILALLLVACGRLVDAQGETVATPTPGPAADQLTSPVGTPLPGNLDTVVFFEDGKRYEIFPLLQPDGIRPVYDPEFTDNPEVYPDNELVMGVEINGDARAYSVSYLNRREMVNDVVGGTPVLVTW